MLPGWKKSIPKTTGGILAGIILAALIPVLLIQIVIYGFWYKTRIETEQQANLEFARSVSASFNAYIQDMRRQLLVLGRAIESDPEFYVQKAGGLLTILKNEYASVIRFSLVSDQGIIQASSDPAFVGVSVSDRDYFRNITAGKSWVISDLNRGPLTNTPQFDLAIKFQTNRGERGLIVAVIDPDARGGIVLSLDRTAEGNFAIFDRSGTLVFFSGSKDVPHGNWAKQDPVLRKSMQGEEAVGTILYPISGRDHIVARVPIDTIGWTAGASRAVENVMAPIYRNLLWVGILNGIFLLISIAGALVLRRFFILKLDRLREQARLIAAGDFSPRVNIGNPVELVELEKSFNIMAEVVKSRQDSLQRAVLDLTRSNSELEQFAYVASHDLQEPLRVITGFVQLIEKKYRGQLDGDADRYIGFITEAVQRQQHLIRDLLAYSRLGRQEPNLAATDANRAVHAALQNLHRIIDEAKATVTKDELPIVRADVTQLVQLFQNLVHNGIKFRSTAPTHIHISANRQNGDWVFAVRDNGIGIESQYWTQIFVMFKRLHTRKDYPGTGIGLAICKKIVERHGGRIWLESKPGEGSTFFFTFKAAGEQ